MTPKELWNELDNYREPVIANALSVFEDDDQGGRDSYEDKLRLAWKLVSGELLLYGEERTLA